jgi:hypothetical protein
MGSWTNGPSSNPFDSESIRASEAPVSEVTTGSGGDDLSLWSDDMETKYYFVSSKKKKTGRTKAVTKSLMRLDGSTPLGGNSTACQREHRTACSQAQNLGVGVPIWTSGTEP